MITIKKNLIHNPSEGLTCYTPSKTQQQFKEECDVNNILRNYVSTGVLTHVNEREPIYGDFTEVPKDYGEMINLIHESEEKFASLPSDIRKRFDENPANMINFLQDEKNMDEAIKLGLVKPVEKVEKSVE